jgi:hypothetical protein
MSREENVELPVAYVQWLVLLKLLPWMQLNGYPAKKIYTA